MATLQQQVQQLAAQCIDADLTHVRDTDLECAKYRRVMQLEQQLNDANTAYLSSKSQHERDLQRLDDARDKLEYMKLLAGEDGRKLQDYQAQISKQDAWIEQEDGARNILQSNLRDANAEIKRLTALSQTHAASWKAACVRSEQLQKQLDHGQAQFASLHEAYNQQIDDEREMLAQIDKLFAERDNMRTEYEYSLMRLRVRCFALVCAVVFLIVSGLVVWGGV